MSSAAPLFARPLPSPQPREHALWRHFTKLANDTAASASSASSPFRHLAVRRSALKGRWLATDRSFKRGELVFAERPVLSVSDDPSVCLACDERHGGAASSSSSSTAAGAVASSSKCARFTALFGSMKVALASVDGIAEQTDYPVARLRELLKFVALTHAATFAPERVTVGTPKRTEQQRRDACPLWLLLGLDDGSHTVEHKNADGSIRYETTPRSPDAHRSTIATQMNAVLPLTFRKHYPPPLLEQVLNVLELNAHETSESGLPPPTTAAEGCATAAALSSSSASSSAAVTASVPRRVEGSSGDSVFPFFAMIEHSCVENCCWTASNDTMRITALRDITAANSSDRAPPRMDFDFHTALVRGVSSSFASALQMASPPVVIDAALASQQHQAYTDVLRAALPGGVIEVAASSAHPDCSFIEDTALVLGDVVVIARPGAPSRRGEEDAVASVTSSMQPGFRRHLRLTEPATLDGGDVLFTGRHLFVGESKRTNAAATAQLRAFFESDPLVRFSVHPVPVLAGLHLKSVVSILADGVLVLADNDVAGRAVRAAIETVDPSYSFVLVPDAVSSNVLRVGKTLLIQRGFPRSESILRAAAAQHGLKVETLEMSELILADGALTCGSLLVPKLPLAAASASAAAAPDASAADDEDAGLTALSINYAPVFLPTSKRRAYLRSCYGFDCVCPVCRGELPDLARGFRCAQPKCTGGVVCPFGVTGRWSCCTRCGVAPSASQVAAYLAAETLVLDSVLALPAAAVAAASARDAVPLGEGEDVLDRLAADPVLLADMQARVEQIVQTACAAAAATADGQAAASGMPATSSSSSAAPSSSSSSSASPVVSAGELKVGGRTVAARQRKAAAARRAASKRAAGSGAGASFFILTPEQKAAVLLLTPQHYIVHQAAELLLSARLSQVLSLPAEQVSSAQWSSLLSLAHTRLASLKTVLRSDTHWSLARELDRLGAVATLGGRWDAARDAWDAALHVHRTCFGEEADSTRRARIRAQQPPRTREELGLDDEEEDDGDA
jgi:dimethylargininase